MSRSFSNNINSANTFNVWNDYTVTDDRSRILTWLSPLEPRLRHQDVQGSRVRNVGEWLLKTEEFKNWYAGSGGGESDNPLLFCYGDPGVGKTFISSLVIDRLGDWAKGQNAAVACFYFDFAAEKEQSPTSMLGSLLKQVVTGLVEVPKEIAQAYEDSKAVIGGRASQLSDVVEMLQIICSKKRTSICIDALDECAAGNRVKILDSLDQILQKSAGTRIFITGRPHIRPEIARCIGGRAKSISISTKRDDIIRYLHSRLGEDTTPGEMDDSLQAGILRKIPEHISEIFLLVSLNIDAILQETTIYRRRQRLDAMTNGLGLGGAYDATLSRIKGQGGGGSKLGMAALMWISHSERPLKADELCQALAVEIGSPNLHTDNAPAIGTILACCQGLVLVDKKASTVRLIHFTLQEYLRARPALFGAAHSTMAETCLSYLNSEQVKALCSSPPPNPQSVPLLEYSSLYWGMHAKRELSDCAKLLALKLFDDCNNRISTQILLEGQAFYGRSADFDKYLQFSGLHCASFFGIAEIVTGLVEVEGCDINQKDCVGNTPLVWAAWNGHEGVVKILLGRSDVNPNKPDEYGRTPLSCAAWNGHKEVVKILLGREDVNPDEPDKYDGTPLCWAAWYGHEELVEILLGLDDISPGKSDKYGRTPLSCAARNGHEGVVEMLLGRGSVNPDRPDKYGQTPLWWAAWKGHEGVVKILLRQDGVNPDKRDERGQTPLWCTAWNGHEGVVKTLLGREDVNPDKPDMRGQTPLWWAAWNGHVEVVKILLERADVNPNEPDKFRQSPLCWAAWYGHKEVVKILLGRGDVDPDKPDDWGKTPICCAALNGHEGVVKMLLGRDSVNPERPDKYGQTPLWWAAWHGHEGVVEVLLGVDSVNPDKPDDLGQTPLWCAAWNGHEQLVKRLLERRDVDPDKPKIDGRTPLWCAALHGHERVVEMLLRRSDVDPDKPDIGGLTPLSCAALNGHEGVVKTLLRRDDVNPDRMDNWGQTPLFRAAENGREAIVKVLLGRHDVSPNKPDKWGRTLRRRDSF